MATPPTQLATGRRVSTKPGFEFDFEEFQKQFGQFGAGKQQAGQQQFPQFGGNVQFGGGFQQFQPQTQQFQFQGGQPQMGGGFPQFFGGGQQFSGGFPQFQQQPQMQQSQGPAPVQGALTRQGLEGGGFLGGQGNVKYDPRTGELIPGEDRIGPGQFLRKAADDRSRALAEGPGIREAQDFEFTGLPASIAAQGGTLEQLGGAAQNLLGQGGQQLGAGAQTLGTGISELLGSQARIGSQAGTEAATREQALQELANLQRRALSPELDPQQRALFQQRADERRAEIQGIEGGLVDAFQRGRAADLAQLSASGVVDSTTAENALAERERRLAQDILGLTREANELSRGEQLGERNRIAEAAGQFGQLQGLQAAQTGDILANLLGQGVQAGTNIGQLGLGQQGIGAELSKLGVSGLGTAGELGIAARGQEADLQQAALSTRLLGNQLALQNLQSLQNQFLNRRITREQFEQQKRLLEEQMGGGGFFSGLGSFLGGGLLGGFLGNQFGGSGDK